MRHGIFYTTGIIIILSMVSITTSPAQVQMQQTVAVPSAPGPYYAPPSWDQKLPAASRFIILSDWDNAAVLDKETGLVWQRSPSTTPGTWAYASQACAGMVLSNRAGWRLPTIQELGSLMDFSVNSIPRLPSGHPFQNVQPNQYWSVNTSAVNSNYAWSCYFGIGGPATNPKSHNFFYWCVRGGQGVDPQ